MTARRLPRADHARGLAVALLLNAAILALLALGPPDRLRALPSETPFHPVTLRLVRPPPRRPAETHPQERTEAPSTPTTAAPRRPVTPTTAPPVTPLPLAPAPLPAAPAVTAPPGPVDGGDKSATVIRRLLGCGFGGPHRRDSEACNPARPSDAARVDTLSPERRADFDVADRRREELLATHKALEEDLIGARGSNVRYGCRLKGGKLSCSTY